jgi:hypothetical protein
VQAEIPSGLTTMKGKLSLTLEGKAEGTLVSSAAVFEGRHPAGGEQNASATRCARTSSTTGRCNLNCPG